MEPTDEQLALDSIRGDADAFGVLVVRLRAGLIGYLTGLTARREDAEELAQEAFLLAWQRIGSLRHPDRVGRWIFRVAHNLATKRRRGLVTVPLSDEPADRPHPNEAPSPHVALLRAVARLNEAHRDVVLRKHFGGFSGKQIAQQLGVAPGTVRSRLSRAYAELRRLMDGEGADEGARAASD